MIILLLLQSHNDGKTLCFYSTSLRTVIKLYNFWLRHYTENKSRVLTATLNTMEHSMELVEKHCSKYLGMFVDCIQRNPHTWQMDCEPERAKLARCAETNPEIAHIKTTCSQQFQAYEQCMLSNKADPEKCTEVFSVFTACADSALKTLADPESSQELQSSGSR